MAIIDIGSNSVRLVIYEGLSRSPTVLFNEKVLCGLGAGLSRTGMLDPQAVERATASLVRFRALAAQAGAASIHILATAAAREASNGPAFIAGVEAIFDRRVQVLSGRQEAYFSAQGVISGFTHPDGIMGDMGGGSLELVDIHESDIGDGVTTPLGGLRLQELSEGNPERARKIARAHLEKVAFLKQGKDRNFYAVGGTWRSLARLHINRTRYPLHIMHNYELDAREMRKFCARLLKGDLEKVRGIETISDSRRALLPFGAAAMSEVLKATRARKVIISALGIREGYLHTLLDEEVRRKDPLIIAATELAVLRARSAVHARELADWTGAVFAAIGISETEDEKRLRQASCLLADIGWRAHPEYRGEQSLNIIANAAFIGVDHPGRAYLALANYYRHEGLGITDVGPSIVAIASERIEYRARVLGGLMRVAYLFSAAMPGIVPKLRFVKGTFDGHFVLQVPRMHKDLVGERVLRRLARFEKLCTIAVSLELVD